MTTRFLDQIKSIRRSHLITLAEMSLLLAWFVFLRPIGLGGPASYVMVTGTSMLPTLKTGDLVVAQRQDGYAVGEIVAFRVPRGEPAAGAIIIHRIAGEVEGGFVVQGDNKRYPDPWEPTAHDILGRLWLLIPGGARVLAFVRQPNFLGAAAGIWGMAFVLSYGKGKKAGSRRQTGSRRQRSNASAVGIPVRPRRSTSPRAGSSPLPCTASVNVEQGVAEPRAIPTVTHMDAATERASFLALSASSRAGRRVLIKQALPPDAIVYIEELNGFKRFHVQTRAGSQIHDVANG